MEGTEDTIDTTASVVIMTARLIEDRNRLSKRMQNTVSEQKHLLLSCLKLVLALHGDVMRCNHFFY